MASKWPKVGIQPTNPTEHALQLKNDAANLKAYITIQSKKPIIHHVAIKLLESAESLMDKILNQPSLAEVMAEIKAVNRHTTQTNENVTVIKNTIEKCASMSGDTSATSGYKKMRTWAQMAAGAPPMHVSPPTSFLQPSTGTNTTKPEISQKADRTITIKLHNPEAQKLYRQRPSSHSLKRVNDALSKSGNSAINKLKMLAFNQLKSGDITLLAATVA